MTKSGGRHASARYKNTRICVLSPSPSLSPHGAALTFVKRGAADTPSAKPVLNIHILLFHTPHPQRNGVRALCSGAVSRLPAGKEYKLEFVYPTVGANCVRPPNCHSEPLGEESRFVYFYFALLEILRFAQDDKLVVVGINLCGRAGACSRRQFTSNPAAGASPRPTCTRLISCVGAIHESPARLDVILRNNTEVVPYS